jgi:DNA-binding response OmpR family regulator
VARILVVEDEGHLAEGLAFNLEAEGHEVEIIADGAEAAERLAREPRPDVVILDVMLPRMSGFEVARRTRAAGNFVPILILTAKDESGDIVRGIEEGADDYLTKPFRLDELLVRLRALLRRRKWDNAAEGAPSALKEVAFGDVVARLDRLELETPSGTVQLTPREAALLRELIVHEGEPLTRGDLLESVWGLKPDTRTRVVDSFIVRLRRYVERDPANPKHIESVRGHGYRFVR